MNYYKYILGDKGSDGLRMSQATYLASLVYYIFVG